MSARGLESLSHLLVGAMHVIAVTKNTDDPDGPIWMLTYGAVALFSFVSAFRLRSFSHWWPAAIALACVCIAWGVQLVMQIDPTKRELDNILETELGRESTGLTFAAIQFFLIARTLYNVQNNKGAGFSIFTLLHLATGAVAVLGIIMAFNLGSRFGIYQPPVCKPPVATSTA
eukprot:TRINITY_DN59_c0_g1_i1.p1 TRINITY_DN59_c0_g1~~TRINITY_DN59_c0_g1_i1.p1  ORF type:complete len:173 (-),score=36.19 TRINITY_DN59_c0_g1_i1:46-564(-)